MKARAIKGLMIAGILLLIDRLSSFLPLKNMFDQGFINRAVFSENIVIGDYTSALHLFVIVMIIFVFTEEYVNTQNMLSQLIRYADLQKWYKNRIKKAAIVSFLLAVIYIGIEVVCCFLYADVGLLIKHGMIEAFLLQLLVITLYLILIWQLKECLKIVYTTILSQLLTIFSVSAYYFAMSYKFSGSNMINFIAIIRNYGTSRYQLGDCLCIILQLIGMVIVEYQIMVFARRRRDLWL